MALRYECGSEQFGPIKCEQFLFFWAKKYWLFKKELLHGLLFFK